LGCGCCATASTTTHPLPSNEDAGVHACRLRQGVRWLVPVTCAARGVTCCAVPRWLVSRHAAREARSADGLCLCGSYCFGCPAVLCRAQALGGPQCKARSADGLCLCDLHCLGCPAVLCCAQDPWWAAMQGARPAPLMACASAACKRQRQQHPRHMLVVHVDSQLLPSCQSLHASR
jgi:hypothetical protein